MQNSAKAFRRFSFILLLLSPVGVWAADKKVIALRSSALNLYGQALQSFQQCLKGKNAAITLVDITLPENPAEAEAKLRGLAAEAPDLVLSLGSSATRLVREHGKGLPAVFCMVLDPHANGFTSGGVSLDVRPSTQINYIKSNFSQLKRVAIIFNPTRSADLTKELREIKQKETGVEVILVEVSGMGEMDGAVDSLKGKADALLMVSDPVLYSAQTASQLILKTLQSGIALIAISPAYVKAGALAGMYADYSDNGCSAGELGARVLAGENPSAIPVLWQGKTKTSVNLVVADRLGIKMAPATISGADEVVK